MTNPRRIVHVIAGLGVGGAEHYLRRLVLSSREMSGPEHVVISLSSLGKVGEMLRDAGVTVEALGMRSALGIPSALFALRRHLLALRPDIVQGWMYHGDLLGGLAARWAQQGRVVWGVRASQLVEGTPRLTRFTRWMCARLSTRVPDVIVCAAEAGRRAHAAIGYDERKMRVIPNGFSEDGGTLEPNERERVRDELAIARDAQVVGLVGRFHPVKGVDNFVRAAGLLRTRFPDLRFLMVGRGFDRGNRELMHWVAQSDVQDRLVLAGERADVPRCLTAMDVSVLSSRAEGFPNVVGEAMAAGVPCVVTDVGDAALLVGQTGRVVPPEDSAALADGVAQLLALSPDERHTLGDAARTRIRTEFSMTRSYARYAALYDEMLDVARRVA